MNNNIFDIIGNAYQGYASYLWREITNPGWHNYFYALIVVSLFFLALEWLRPWRETQPKFRKDFWLDAFYMFFNFFFFSLIIYNAGSDVVVHFVNKWVLQLSGINLAEINPLYNWPMWAVLLTGFLIRDFVQWWTHRLLHYNERLWEFHKVHHSVEQMGFAAHLRYHWMETIVYRSLEYLPLAFLGIGLYDFFIIHIFTLGIGHFNHSNITVSPKISGSVLGGLLGIVIGTGAFEINILNNANLTYTFLAVFAGILIGYFLLSKVMRILFNHPEMHIWHHAYNLPETKRYGVNFGISLALWDYLFGTVYVPHNGRDIKLGFPGLSKFPKTFVSQIIYGFK
jgi:sterol desaturase/sphingolipid hydroxylase (fatty acid hydroxylase superfamily)